jgi:hypothetical protein
MEKNTLKNTLRLSAEDITTNKKTALAAAAQDGMATAYVTGYKMEKDRFGRPHCVTQIALAMPKNG